MDDTRPRVTPAPVILVIADISGYTRYLVANAKDLAHSQAIISDLLEAVLREVELPLAVAKFEGDAVFLAGRKPTTGPLPPEQRQALGQRLVRFLDVFRQRVRELEQATLCRCSACRHIGDLKLKLVVHSGEALFHRIAGHEELAGPDIIIVHRLLKNSVAASEYILLTEAAAADVELPRPLRLRSTEEHVADLGVLRTWVCDDTGLARDWRGPRDEPLREPERGRAVRSTNEGLAVAGCTLALEPHRAPLGTPARPEPATFLARLRRAARWHARLWFSPVRADRPQPASGRVVLAAFTVVATPLFLPVGLLLLALRLATQALGSKRPSPAPVPALSGSVPAPDDRLHDSAQ